MPFQNNVTCALRKKRGFVLFGNFFLIFRKLIFIHLTPIFIFNLFYFFSQRRHYFRKGVGRSRQTNWKGIKNKYKYIIYIYFFFVFVFRVCFSIPPSPLRNCLSHSFAHSLSLCVCPSISPHQSFLCLDSGLPSNRLISGMRSTIYQSKAGVSKRMFKKR